MIYLDNAATSFPKPEAVYIEMDRVNRSMAVNTGRGSYKAARIGADLIDDTKSRLLNLFNAKGVADIVFTPSVTHAINQVLRGLKITGDSVIYETPYEHNAVARTVEDIRKNTGCKVKELPLTETLEIDLEKTEFMFSVEQPSVVIINAVSNVTGYILPVNEICKIAKKYGAFVMVDAAQAAGLIPLDFRIMQADVLCFAGHKTLQGPFGIAGFLIDSRCSLFQVFTGGTGSNSLVLDMPAFGAARYEASSTNIVAVAGLNAALKEISVEKHYNTVQELTEYLINELSSLDNIRVLGHVDQHSVGIVSIVVEGYRASDIGTILDEEFDIAVRTGFHCAPFIHKYLADEEYGGTVRIGLGAFNKKQDVDALVNALATL